MQHSDCYSNVKNKSQYYKFEYGGKMVFIGKIGSCLQISFSFYFIEISNLLPSLISTPLPRLYDFT